MAKKKRKTFQMSPSPEEPENPTQGEQVVDEAPPVDVEVKNDEQDIPDTSDDEVEEAKETEKLTVQQVIATLATSSDVNKDYQVLKMRGQVLNERATEIELKRLGHAIE